MALVKKIDDELPIRIAEMSSPLDEQVKAAQAASLRAHDAALKRVEGVYTAVVWTDRVITAVQFIGFGWTVGAGARQVYKYYVSKNMARAAAFQIAASYTVTQIAVAATTFAVATKVVPAVLSYAGLDETEVQVGMAAFAAIGVLAGLGARPVAGKVAGRAASRRIKDRDRPNARRTDPHPGKGPRWDKSHPLIEGVPDAGRTPAHRFLQQTVAEDMQATGDYVRVGMGRRLSEFSGVKHSPDIKPDNIGLTTDGKIDMIEIKSPGQTRLELEDKLLKALDRLPTTLRGSIRVIDPEDAFK